MGYDVMRVGDNVHALALWDESWNSYNNCYLIGSPTGAIMVDCGKAEHQPQLLEALRTLGVEPGQVSALIATHRHMDHIGAYRLFPRAAKYIHPEDRAELPAEVQQAFSLDLPDDGDVLEFRCVRLKHHTPGSVGLFHSPSGALFPGDHICFFGAPLPDGALVSEGVELRKMFRAFVHDWAGDQEARAQQNFAGFLQGLRSLRQFPAEFLCTGHGAVLNGGIPEFLGELVGLDIDVVR